MMGAWIIHSHIYIFNTISKKAVKTIAFGASSKCGDLYISMEIVIYIYIIENFSLCLCVKIIFV